MNNLFESASINNLVLANRFVRSATWEGLARDDGSSTPELAEVMAQLARGGVGLIITGHAYVSREGQAGPRQLGIYSDDHLAGLSEMTRTVHAIGGQIAAQLAHAGARSASRLSGLDPIGPSATHADAGPLVREMTRDNIDAVTQAFACAAVRAREAGFDAVEIHAATAIY